MSENQNKEGDPKVKTSFLTVYKAKWGVHRAVAYSLHNDLLPLTSLLFFSNFTASAHITVSRSPSLNTKLLLISFLFSSMFGARNLRLNYTRIDCILLWGT
jgi:hypothetical protein